MIENILFWWALAIIAAALVDISKAISKKGKQETPREDPHEDPCDSCLRWSECNGVDDQCPWRGKE